LARRRRCLEKKDEETHPVSQLQARGWVIVVIVVRCLKVKDPPRFAIASEGVGYRRCRGCRRRQMTTTSLHGSSSSSSFVVLKKRIHPVSQLQARGWVV